MSFVDTNVLVQSTATNAPFHAAARAALARLRAAVQRWMGHAQLTTTAIYAEAVGEEERSIAAHRAEP